MLELLQQILRMLLLPTAFGSPSSNLSLPTAALLPAVFKSIHANGVAFELSTADFRETVASPLSSVITDTTPFVV